MYSLDVAWLRQLIQNLVRNAQLGASFAFLRMSWRIHAVGDEDFSALAASTAISHSSVRMLTFVWLAKQ